MEWVYSRCLAVQLCGGGLFQGDHLFVSGNDEY